MRGTIFSKSFLKGARESLSWEDTAKSIDPSWLLVENAPEGRLSCKNQVALCVPNLCLPCKERYIMYYPTPFHLVVQVWQLMSGKVGIFEFNGRCQRDGERCASDKMRKSWGPETCGDRIAYGRGGNIQTELGRGKFLGGCRCR